MNPWPRFPGERPGTGLGVHMGQFDDGGVAIIREREEP